MRQANATGTDLAPIPIDVELRVFEQYPRSIRDALNDATIKVNSLSMVEYFHWARRNGHGDPKVVEKIRAMEENDIAVFAGRHRARYRYELPHVAAGATILRYGTAARKRRRRL